eukprot:1935351-Rhodomonas_salina.3
MGNALSEIGELGCCGAREPNKGIAHRENPREDEVRACEKSIFDKAGAAVKDACGPDPSSQAVPDTDIKKAKKAEQPGALRAVVLKPGRLHQPVTRGVRCTALT